LFRRKRIGEEGGSLAFPEERGSATPELRKRLYRGLPVPKVVDTPEVHAAWEDYTAYRSERKLSKLQERSIKAQLEEFEDWGPERTVAAIKLTIRKGWQGIHEGKGNANGPTRQDSEKRGPVEVGEDGTADGVRVLGRGQD